MSPRNRRRIQSPRQRSGPDGVSTQSRRLVIVLMRHRVDLQLVVCDADGYHGLNGPQPRERAVVEAAAVAEAIARGIEGEQRHQHDVGLEHRLVGQRLGDAPLHLAHRITRAPGAKHERQPLALHHRQAEPIALAAEPRQQCRRVDLVADGGEARDDGARRNLQERKAVRGEQFTGRGARGRRRPHARRASARVLAARLSSPVCMNDSAAVAVEADDPALVPTRVGGRRVSETTVPARDSSLADLIGPGEHMCF